MKIFILISFLLVCQGSNEEEDNIVAGLYFD